MKLSEPDADESLLNSRLIAYASDQVGYKTKTNKPILLSSHPDHTDDNMNLHYCTKRKIQVWTNPSNALTLFSADGEMKLVWDEILQGPSGP